MEVNKKLWKLSRWLAEKAMKLCRTVLPAAASWQWSGVEGGRLMSGVAHGALELSYWLAANLPLGVESR